MILKTNMVRAIISISYTMRNSLWSDKKYNLQKEKGVPENERKAKKRNFLILKGCVLKND